jgi:D-inositol-3-phosphate glycosyltransferase
MVAEAETTRPLRSCVLFHEGVRQGAGVAVERVLPGLRRRGWSQYAWFPYQGPMQDAIEPLVDGSRFRQGYFAFSVSGWRRSPGVARRLAGLPGYFRALRAMLAEVRPDVVHANTLLSLPEATVAHRMGLPVVLHMHELPEPGLKTDVTLRSVATVADVVVTVADAVQELFAPYAAATTSLRVYNGLPDEAFADPKLAGTSGRLLVGTIGGATFRKGVDLFLDAAREVVADCTDVDFLHVGPEPWESDGFAQAIAARVGAFPQGRLTMAGVLPAAKPLRSMDVFVMASRQEPFALASLEAMAAGVPIIAASVGGLPEQIEHLVSGILVPPDDHRAIALWIRRLRDDPSLRVKLGEGARARAKELFPLERQCAGIDAAYRQAIALRRSPAST